MSDFLNFGGELHLGNKVQLFNGDSREVLKLLPDASVDSVVTDPPYALVSIVKRFGSENAAPASGDDAYSRASAGFMGKTWDTGETAFAVEFWAEVMRVLKPGGHVVAASGTRTYHRLAVAIEDAGFEIRDMISWLYGSGFPKSHSVDKATRGLLLKRYGEKKCNCMDSGDGRPLGDDPGRGSGPDLRDIGGNCLSKTESLGGFELPKKIKGRANSLCELRKNDRSAEEGSSAIKETVLLAGVRKRRPEAPRQRDSKVWPGLEEQAGRDTSSAEGLSDLRENSGTERIGAPCSPSEAIPVRGNEPTPEPEGSLRPVPPSDRVDDRAGFVRDPDKRHDRSVNPDDFGRPDGAVAQVCSWCGFPDQEWIASLSGLGSALKPACEPWVLARKPFKGTVAANVLEHGTGAINVDGCRVGEPIVKRAGGLHRGNGTTVGSFTGTHDIENQETGRWPANVIHDGSDEVVAGFPSSTSTRSEVTSKPGGVYGGGDGLPSHTGIYGFDDSGSAARFFYSAKADKMDRIGSKHPTVKPVDLMQYLCRLITPPGGIVLDPFAGSGSTGEAAWREGFRCVLIEREEEYADDIRQRLSLAKQGTGSRKRAITKQESLPEDGLFGLFGGQGV